MSLLPSENHTLIIQTFAEIEPEPCEIKINVTRAQKNRYCNYIFSKKYPCKNPTYSKKTRQGYKI